MEVDLKSRKSIKRVISRNQANINKLNKNCEKIENENVNQPLLMNTKEKRIAAAKIVTG